MSQQCPKCSRVLDFPGEPVPFCCFCGAALKTTGGSSDPDATRAPDALQQPEMPERLGDYRLIRRLGQGGMGAVFEGEHLTTGRRVAVKVIDAEATPDAIERFRQEGRLASAIDHPRCVFVYHADEDRGRPYIILELMPGRTLEDVVQQRGPLPLADALRYVFDLIEGLEQVHRMGVIHRDVKPSNCFLDEGGRVKVGDFGLARSLQVSTRLTRTGTFVGTPLFAAPEQILNQPLDPRADVYAVCATLYYLVTGRAPHDRGDGDYLAVLARVVAEDAPPLRARRAGLPPGLREVLARGLARQREQRWENLDALWRALADFRPASASQQLLPARLAAYFIDGLVLSPAGILLHWQFGPDLTQLWTDPSSFQPSWQQNLGGLALSLAYYTLGDGLAGGTPGKLLVGLRVSRSDHYATPGLPRAFARTAAWLGMMLPASLFVALTASPDQSDLFALVGWVLMIGQFALLFGTMRRGNGFRALYELLSGTRVVFAPARPERVVFPSSTSEICERSTEIDRLGPYQVRGAARISEGEQVLLGLDPALGRPVWLWLRPAASPAVPPRRREVFRPARLRWLACGEQGEWRWDAFLAPRGGRLLEVMRLHPRLDWEQARTLLAQLVEELRQAASEGSLTLRLSLEQLWLTPDGQMQLLDFLPCEIAEGPTTPIDLVARAASVLLEGRSPQDETPAAPPRTPLPGGARRLLARLPRFGGREARLDDVAEELEAMRDRPARVTRLVRLVHVGLLAGMFWLCGCFWLGALFGGVSDLVVSAMMVKGAEKVRASLADQAEKSERGRTARAAAGAAGVVSPTLTPTTRLSFAALARREAALARVAAFQARQDREAVRGLEQALLLEREYQEARRAAMWPPHRFFLTQQLALWESMPEQEARVTTTPANLREEARTHTFFLNRRRATPDFLIWVHVFLMSLFPAVCVASAFVFRGGLRSRLLKLEVQRMDGRPAGRLRCAWRGLAGVGVPFGLLIAVWLIESTYWRNWTPGADLTTPAVVVPALQGLAITLGLGSLIYAVAFPTRALHDYLAGTCLMPR